MTLILENISHSYGKTQVLEQVHLKVKSGDVTCLLGPSGCGKTTLLRIIAGLESLQRGSISIENIVVAGNGREMPPEQRGVGFLFQDFALFPHLSILDNTLFGLAHIHDKKQRKAMAAAALEQVGMDGFLSAYPHELSGGQQQRTALARALAPRPKIILLDEPFSSLDTRLRNRIRDDTLHILKKCRVATVMVTHDPEEAMFMGDDIVLMNRGRIVQQGKPEQLYYRPANAFAATFFSDVNEIGAHIEGSQALSIVGPVQAPGIKNGAAVRLMFRPEAVLLNPSDINRGIKPVEAEVTASRLLPGFTLVHLKIDANSPGAEASFHIHAKVPGIFRCGENMRVQLSIDPGQIFLFPADDEQGAFISPPPDVPDVLECIV